MANEGSESGSGLFGDNGRRHVRITDRVHEVVDRASISASDIAHRTREGFGTKLRDLTDLIARRPMAAVVLAFGVGYLFARRRLRA